METKNIIICFICSLLVAIVTFNLAKQEMFARWGNAQFSERIKDYCSETGFSRNWEITMSTTSPGKGQFECYPLEELPENSALLMFKVEGSASKITRFLQYNRTPSLPQTFEWTYGALINKNI